MHWAFLLLWRVPQSLLLKNSPIAWGGYQHTLLLGWYSAGDEQCLLSFKHDAWNWGSSDQNQIILFITVWGSFRCFFANFKCVFMCLHWREDWVWPHHHNAQIGWCLSFCRFLHIWSWSSTRVTIRFFVTTLTKALLHQLLSLARRPALRRILVETSSIKGNRDYTLLWPFNEAEFVSELYPRCVAWCKPVSELYRLFFWPHGLAFALICIISFWTFY